MKEDGLVVENEEEMVEMFIQFLTINNPNDQGNFQDPNNLLDVIPEVITIEDLSQLTEKVTFQ